MSSASATPASEPVVKKGKFPFGLDCFIWHISQVTSGVALSLTNSQTKGAGYFLNKGDDAMSALREIADFNFRKYTDRGPVIVTVEFSRSAVPHISTILASISDFSKIRKLDEQVLTSYFGRELMTYFRMQSGTSPLTLLETKTRECLTIYGFILPPGFSWAEKKKQPRDGR